jgi:CheY-like chemotaxis protein
VINASIMKQLGGTADFDWKSSGLVFSMSVQLTDGGSNAEVGAAASTMQLKKMSRPGSDKGYILLVEDEALVGMMMADLLSDLGFEVLGPYGQIADAVEAIGRQPVRAAVLDINLGGELVYDLAELLVNRGLPIVFVTGYGAEGLDQRFAHAPVLQKPVDAVALQQVLQQSGQVRESVVR